MILPARTADAKHQKPQYAENAHHVSNVKVGIDGQRQRTDVKKSSAPVVHPLQPQDHQRQQPYRIHPHELIDERQRVSRQRIRNTARHDSEYPRNAERLTVLVPPRQIHRKAPPRQRKPQQHDKIHSRGRHAARKQKQGPPQRAVGVIRPLRHRVKPQCARQGIPLTAQERTLCLLEHRVILPPGIHRHQRSFPERRNAAQCVSHRHDQCREPKSAKSAHPHMIRNIPFKKDHVMYHLTAIA